jgi:hypothetical protein
MFPTDGETVSSVQRNRSPQHKDQDQHDKDSELCATAAETTRVTGFTALCEVWYRDEYDKRNIPKCGLSILCHESRASLT